ncbi:MAG: DHH family phosphoesterase [Treponema sp.]|jgi:nanoRNase/pAp phosphatase (c-di-AMP/oligoRNAs hydrolase)|nr:DHH family phosphoesterase [Treponema sp.]
MMAGAHSSGAFSRMTALLEDHFGGRGKGTAVIQTHDFPDHDAAASAFALARLLEKRGIEVRLCYRGIINSFSLKTMIRDLEIPLHRVHGTVKDLRSAPCIVVDGNPTNTNARPVTDFLFGVVDHHANSGVPGCPFTDIRTNCGSCAAIIAGYWKEERRVPDRKIATALLMGIEMDTDFLSRRVMKADMDALHRLFFVGDWEYGTRVVKTSLSTQNLPAFEEAVTHARLQGKMLFSRIPLETSQEVIAILADFFLRFREIFVTVVIEDEGAERHISVRSRDPALSAALIIREALRDIGEGGGHDYMAGGVIDPAVSISEEELFRRFTDAMEKTGGHQ